MNQLLLTINPNPKSKQNIPFNFINPGISTDFLRWLSEIGVVKAFFPVGLNTHSTTSKWHRSRGAESLPKLFF
jgi:hypothetical protein